MGLMPNSKLYSPEPHNPFDARAVALECLLLNNKWGRVGYMVTDALSAIHETLQNKEIVSVELARLGQVHHHWSRSAPGWYCGIKKLAKRTLSH